MSNNSEKKKGKIKQFLPILFGMIIGAVCGILMVEYVDSLKGVGKTKSERYLSLALLFIGMYLAIFLQIIIHEAGHLLFGLLTGYRFLSFRVGSFMWIKEGGNIKLRKFSLAGTGGQCLLIPPEMKDGKYPYVLYNLGGSIVNILSALLFCGVSLVWGNLGLISPFFMILAIVGGLFAFINGIPMQMTVNNDGHNALSLKKDKEALRSFWIQLKSNALIATGVHLKDMPEEWFEMPSDEAMNNSIIAALGVLACSRLMEQQSFDEARKLMEDLLHRNNGIVKLHRNLLVVDQIYCELIGENRSDMLDSLLDKQQKKFMKVMKNYPSVIRTQYVYALLAKKEISLATRIKNKFDKVAKTYPHPSEIITERELIDYADRMVTEA